jgi:hypothetical protein
MRLPLLAVFALGACVSGSAVPKAASTPIFDPIAFFSGGTEGNGRLKVLFRAPSEFRVHGRGRIEADGSLVLEQKIERPGHADKQRRWRIARRPEGGYTAVLTSAEGPVAASVEGNLLRLDFREDNLRVHQDILLAPDGRSAINHMSLKRFGLRVATIEERITRSN